MTREEAAARLKELQEMNIPFCTYADIRQLAGIIDLSDLSEEDVIGLENYFQIYCPPGSVEGCLFCGSYSSQWGLVHGMMMCNDCGLESRAYHYMRDVLPSRKDDHRRLAIHLQYHPSCFSVLEE